jgi:glycosyltransferase involved in cell wall biosynthesis
VRAEEEWVSELKALTDVKNIEVNMNRSVGFHDLRSLRALGKTIKDSGPYDIIHGHSSKAGALVKLLPKSISGQRIYTPHAFATMDPNCKGLKRLVFNQIEKSLSSRGDATIVVSEMEKQHATKIGIVGETIKVVNGVNKKPGNDRLAARKKMKLTDQDCAIGFVGRLAYQKNPERFMRIIELARENAKTIKGIMIGDGELRDELENSLAGSNENIVFMGWQNAVDLMPGLDAFLMTSRYEAMPYTLIEALAAGLPIFSTHVGGVMETIKQNENGQIFEQNASDLDIAMALAKFANDPGQQKSWSDNSLQLSEVYTIEKMVGQTVDIYESGYNQNAE